jgi:alpha-L-rhamnosidase
MLYLGQMLCRILLLTALLWLTGLNQLEAQSAILRDMRCEYLPNPIGIDESHPRFTWKWNSVAATGSFDRWQLQVFAYDGRQSEPSKIWDSSGSTLGLPLVRYNGKPLQPFGRYYWQLTIRDRQGRPLFSDTAYFETGMMDEGNWKGAWISDHLDRDTKAAPMFRKTFNVRKKIRTARVYVAVAGLYELSFNGQIAGDRMLDPAYTRFDRRIMYSSYDISNLLNTGENVVGIILGNGWYNHQSTAVWNFHEAPWRNRPAFCMDIRLVYEDGSVEIVGSDREWKTNLSSIVFNSIYTGEHWDNRKNINNWNQLGFADSNWSHARYRSAPASLIVSQAMHPIRSTDTILPTEVKRIDDTTIVVKFPFNLAGVSRLTVDGKEGTVVRLKHGERLYANGRVDQSNLDVHYRPTDESDPFQTDIFVLGGQGIQSFQPKFNYKGFQYVEISWNGELVFQEPVLEAIRMSSDVPVAGTISTSHPLLMPLWRATNNSYLSNLFGYPTDCPQREKNGWTGDAHIAQETGLYNYDGITIYEKWMADHRDEQQPNGVLPSIIPTGGWGYEWGNGPDWTSTIAIVPWNLYLFYGDPRALERTYESIRRYVDYIDQNYPSGITSWGLGDWIPVKSQTPVPFTSTAYYFKDVSILANAARVLGKVNDERKYQALAKRIQQAFNKAYFDTANAIYGSGLQTELSVALHFGLVPASYRQAVADRLAERVLRDSVKLDVGLLGTKSILNALSDNGHADLAYRLATRDSFPSWGWWIRNGATSLYENWPIDAASDISMNHIMFGEIGAWMYKGLAGIRPIADKPGFRHFILQPYMPQDLKQFNACYDSPFGRICSGWDDKGAVRTYTAVVPPFSTADLLINIPDGRKLYQNGKQLRTNQAQFSRLLTAGTHVFEIR